MPASKKEDSLAVITETLSRGSEFKADADVARFRQRLQEIQKQESLVYISPARWSQELWKDCLGPQIEYASTLWSRTSTIQKVTKSQFATQLVREFILPLVHRACKDQALYYAHYDGLDHGQMIQQLNEELEALCERAYEEFSGEPLPKLEAESKRKATVTNGTKELDPAKQPEKRVGRRTTAAMIRRARILWKHFPDGKMPVSFEDNKLKKAFSELDSKSVPLPQSKSYRKHDSYLELLAAWMKRTNEKDSAAQEAYFALEKLMQTFKKTLERYPHNSVQGQN